MKEYDMATATGSRLMAMVTARKLEDIANVPEERAWRVPFATYSAADPTEPKAKAASVANKEAKPRFLLVARKTAIAPARTLITKAHGIHR